jgi:hypothetical protein
MISLERACTMGVLILAGLVTAAVPVYANSPSLADRVIEHKLANGMTVLMVERHQAPIVSINMTFGVGGVNEQVGLTGLAHLYEHMAFKGTRTVGTRDYEREQAVLDDLTLVGNELDGRDARVAFVRLAGSDDNRHVGNDLDLRGRRAALAVRGRVVHRDLLGGNCGSKNVNHVPSSQLLVSEYAHFDRLACQGTLPRDVPSKSRSRHTLNGPRSVRGSRLRRNDRGDRDRIESRGPRLRTAGVRA